MSYSDYYVQKALGGSMAAFQNRRCDTFTTNPCTTAEADKWDAMGAALGFTDFVPSFVNWNVPTPSRGDAAARTLSRRACRATRR